MRDDDESVRRMMEIGLELEGLYRHASTHAAGVVIGDRPLVELVPLYRDPKADTLVTQFSMKYVEQAGLVKFDFLGLTTLTILQRAVGFMKDPVDLERLPLDDAPTYTMLARGDAGGVFQFESAGMRDVLRQMRPDRFEDLIAAVALFRPGPMANIPDYCRRKHGEAWEAPHPEIQPILAETYGIMVYQEQVMQIAQTMAGYSLGGADMLRRAMGKKIRSEMDAQRQTFVDGSTKRGIPKAKPSSVRPDGEVRRLRLQQIARRRLCPGRVPDGMDEVELPGGVPRRLHESGDQQHRQAGGVAAGGGAARHRVLPPDINRSGADFKPDVDADGKPAIRYALAAVKKVGMCGDEDAGGPARRSSVCRHDGFAARVDPKSLNKMQIENLVRAGAFDGLSANRGQMFAGAELVLAPRAGRCGAEESGQIGLFGGSRPEPLRFPDTTDWPPMERLGYERRPSGST